MSAEWNLHSIAGIAPIPSPLPRAATRAALTWRSPAPGLFSLSPLAGRNISATPLLSLSSRVGSRSVRLFAHVAGLLNSSLCAIRGAGFVFRVVP